MEELNLDPNGSSHNAILNNEIENMLEQTQLLYKQIDATLQRVLDENTMKQQLPSTSTTNNKSSSELPLQREEIAKLLLLSSRAHSIQQINVQQWRAIKDEICRRNGNLRMILKQTDISAVMNALATINLS